MTNSPEVYCSNEDVDDNRTWALLSYFSILFILPLLAAPKSKFAKYHANQGLILFLASIPISFVMMVISPFTFAVPVIGGLLYPLTFFVPMLIYLLAIGYGVMNSVKGDCKPLPWVGSLVVLIKYE